MKKFSPFLTIEFEQDENGHYAGSIEQIPDIVAEGESLEKLRTELSRHLLEYAKDYYVDFDRYYNSPNRHNHARYVLGTLIIDKIEKALIKKESQKSFK